MNTLSTPIASAAGAVTYPAAGVIPTSPTTAPVAAPTAVILPVRVESSSDHVSTAEAAAAFVLTNASAAMPFAASAEPALNPNHPNHNSPAPMSTRGTLWGDSGTRRKSRRGPRNQAATSADTPALTCTTVPPAKSSAPSCCNQPPAPQTQCASGAYTNVDHNSRNARYARNRIRSTIAPEMSAGVITA